MELHPVIGNTRTRPDFLVTSTANGQFYLEAVLATEESKKEAAAKARMNTIYDGLNRLDSPNFFIGIELIQSPELQPSASQIRTFLEQRLAPLNPDEIAIMLERGGLKALPRWQYGNDGWLIEFFPIPKSPESRGKPGIRPVGLQFEGFKWLETRKIIRDAVLEKSGRYGDLGSPYVVAVNVVADHVDRTDALDALFGDEQIIFQVRSDTGRAGEAKSSRAPNGVWTSPTGPRYTRVSAALVCSRLRSSSIPHASICLYHNPWAARQYDGELNRLNRAVPIDEQIKFLDGESLSSIFLLSADWPGQ